MVSTSHGEEPPLPAAPIDCRRLWHRSCLAQICWMRRAEDWTRQDSCSCRLEWQKLRPEVALATHPSSRVGVEHARQKGETKRDETDVTP